jgi:hypothetical protein
MVEDHKYRPEAEFAPAGELRSFRRYVIKLAVIPPQVLHLVLSLFEILILACVLAADEGQLRIFQGAPSEAVKLRIVPGAYMVWILPKPNSEAYDNIWQIR